MARRCTSRPLNGFHQAGNQPVARRALGRRGRLDGGRQPEGERRRFRVGRDQGVDHVEGRAAGIVEQRRQCLRREHQVVVHQPDPREPRPVRVAHSRVHPARAAEVRLRDRGDPGAAPQPFGGAVRAAVVDHHGGVGQARLPLQAVEAPLEQRQPVEGDDDGANGFRVGRGRRHNVTPAGPACGPGGGPGNGSCGTTASGAAGSAGRSTRNRAG